MGLGSTIQNALRSRYLKQASGPVNLANASLSTAFTDLFMLGSAVGDYDDTRKAGGGVAEGLLNAGGNLALGFMSFPVYIGATIASTAPGLIVNGYDWASSKSRQMSRSGRNVPFQNATFLDSQQTYTMRQAGMNLAKQGRYAAQQAMMGNEAQSVSIAHQGRR